MTVFTLKMIALVTMMLDHSAALITKLLGKEGIYIPLRVIGRIAFPIYAFIIAEGCRHTRDIKKYMGRLLLFALISEIPFDFKRLADTGIYTLLDFRYQNVFFTLFLGVLSVYLYQLIIEKYSKKWVITLLSLADVLFCGLTAEFLRTDYGFRGVTMVFLVYISNALFRFIQRENLRKVIAVIIGIFALYTPVNAYMTFMLIGALTSVIPMLLYNGEKGSSLKWGFYLAYPVHLLIIGVLLHMI